MVATEPRHRVLICGDRNWECRRCINEYVGELPPGTLVINGLARGADMLANEAANRRHVQQGDVPRPLRFRAEWEKYGRSAGPIRNSQMLKEGRPDLVVAFHNNLATSKGTKHMVAIATKAGVPVEVKTCPHRTTFPTSIPTAP